MTVDDKVEEKDLVGKQIFKWSVIDESQTCISG